MTAAECALLTEFRTFLKRLQEERTGGDSEALAKCASGVLVTRGSNETYPVSGAELQAELKMAIWQHLQSICCPKHFQVALLRASVIEAERECRETKDCQYGATAVLEESAKDVQFDLVKLQKFGINCLEKLLTHLTDNAQAASLESYAEKQSICSEEEKCQCLATSSVCQQQPTFTVGRIKNKPRKMEDRHVCLERFSALYELQRQYSFYAVFDGHSGPLAASYAASHLPNMLAKRMQQMPEPTVCAYREALEASFLQTDQMFARKRIFSGSTAVCALLAHTPILSHLYVAWVGDSKALLVSPIVSLQLVKPHKPDTLEERKRIECANSSGGTVIYVQGQWRVNGILNVARSIGDFSVGAVIAEPDFVDVALSDAHDLLVLGTDGLWDHVTEASIVQIVYTALADDACKIEDIPKLLIEKAKQGNSQDNITVVVVLLKDRAKIVEHYKSNL